MFGFVDEENFRGTVRQEQLWVKKRGGRVKKDKEARKRREGKRAGQRRVKRDQEKEKLKRQKPAAVRVEVGLKV